MLYIQQKAANPKKHGFAAIIASQKGLEPPTFRLGVNQQSTENLSIYRDFLKLLQCTQFYSAYACFWAGLNSIINVSILIILFDLRFGNDST